MKTRIRLVLPIALVLIATGSLWIYIRGPFLPIQGVVA
jgi:hypothetical protein